MGYKLIQLFIAEVEFKHFKIVRRQTPKYMKLLQLIKWTEFTGMGFIGLGNET